ncbi:MAG TPA: hypothetical protein VF384_05045 [Planctomycetota bacterium]
MERRDMGILMLVALGAGYAAFVNWDTIAEKLSLDDLSPGRVKAIDMAKKDMTLDSLQANSLVLRERARIGEIRMSEDPWTASRIEENLWLVVMDYTAGGEPHQYRFHVNVATGVVKLLPQTAQPPR